jgi:hypothetical protein
MIALEKVPEMLIKCLEAEWDASAVASSSWANSWRERSGVVAKRRVESTLVGQEGMGGSDEGS